MNLITKAIRGTQDVLPAESYKWQHIEQTALSIARDFGYREMRTPVFEHTVLFQRSVGETTDVVQKEMYTFDDKGGRSITLRPEGTAGAARAMLEHGLLEKLPARPRCLFGLHNRPELPAGTIAVMEGPVMAGKSHFTITLHGKAGHGGSPHKCADVIVAASAVVSALQTVVSRSTDPLDSLVCSVLSIHAGTPENFVPDTLTMTGSIRAHDGAVHARAEQRLQMLAEGVSAAYGCTAQVTFQPGVPATVNSPALTALARRAAEALAGKANVLCPPPDMGSEDFAVLAREMPAFFYWLGSGFPGRANACWHSERFCTDDSALPLGAALLAQSALLGLDAPGEPLH